MPAEVTLKSSSTLPTLSNPGATPALPILPDGAIPIAIGLFGVVRFRLGCRE
jgi:hypothetical protein